MSKGQLSELVNIVVHRALKEYNVFIILNCWNLICLNMTTLTSPTRSVNVLEWPTWSISDFFKYSSLQNFSIWAKLCIVFTNSDIKNWHSLFSSNQKTLSLLSTLFCGCYMYCYILFININIVKVNIAILMIPALSINY